MTTPHRAPAGRSDLPGPTLIPHDILAPAAEGIGLNAQRETGIVVLSTQDFDYVRTLIHKKAAIVLEAEKRYLVEARLQPLARREGLQSVGALIALLRDAPPCGLQQEVVEAMTTNETSFFRDLKPFELLHQVILPELIERRRDERRLAIWSAAASTGQEPYSIALLLRERFPELRGWQVQLIASDLSREVLDKARAGVYSSVDVNRGMRNSMLRRNFQPRGAEWQVADEVRRLIEFRQLNLIEPWPALPALDIIFLRNVLIYFDVATKKSILGRVRDRLRPDGYLFLGGAETTMNLDDRFERLPVVCSSCYRLRSS
jgi:chemotaxis protein methyltransferase CheR